MYESITIQFTENGFMVYENSTANKAVSGTILRTWSFETADGVSKFVKDWGNGVYDDSKTAGDS